MNGDVRREGYVCGAGGWVRSWRPKLVFVPIHTYTEYGNICIPSTTDQSRGRRYRMQLPLSRSPGGVL